MNARMHWDEGEEDRAPLTAEQIRRSRLDAQIGQWFEDRDPKRGRSSQYRRALDAISRAALERAEVSNAPLSGGENSFEGLLERGFSTIDHLRDGLLDYDLPDDEKLKLKLWSHRLSPLDDVKRNKAPYIIRQEIEAAVGEYLELPYRATQIDRLFADVLIAMELYAFAEETFRYNNALRYIITGKMESHPLIEYLSVSIFWAGLVFLLWKTNVISDG